MARFLEKAQQLHARWTDGAVTGDAQMLELPDRALVGEPPPLGTDSYGEL